MSLKTLLVIALLSLPTAAAWVPHRGGLPPTAWNAIEHAGGCSIATDTCSAALCAAFDASEDATGGTVPGDGADCTFEAEGLEPDLEGDIEWLGLDRIWPK